MTKYPLHSMNYLMTKKNKNVKRGEYPCLRVPIISAPFEKSKSFQVFLMKEGKQMRIGRGMGIPCFS